MWGSDIAIYTLVQLQFWTLKVILFHNDGAKYYKPVIAMVILLTNHNDIFTVMAGNCIDASQNSQWVLSEVISLFKQMTYFFPCRFPTGIQESEYSCGHQSSAFNFINQEHLRQWSLSTHHLSAAWAWGRGIAGSRVQDSVTWTHNLPGWGPLHLWSSRENTQDVFPETLGFGHRPSAWKRGVTQAALSKVS